MGDKTKIEWADATWNPIVGCSPVSPGCTNCYAMKQAARIEMMHEGRHAPHAKVGGPEFPTTPYAGLTQSSKAGPVWTGKVALARDDVLTKPLRWKRPRRIFVNSMGDLFHESVPDEWIDRVFAVMALAPQHTFQVLTKRSKRMRAYFSEQHSAPNVDDLQVRVCAAIDALHPTRIKASNDAKASIIQAPLPNVWLGVSAEDQDAADERRGHLRSLSAMGFTTFVSYEPALGPVDWTGWWFVDQIIGGGESGAAARPSHRSWHRATRDFCTAHGIAYFFKQWGEWAPASNYDTETLTPFAIAGLTWGDVVRVGKKHAGRLLDGVEHNAFPKPRA
jgi:protein gp37